MITIHQYQLVYVLSYVLLKLFAGSKALHITEHVCSHLTKVISYIIQCYHFKTIRNIPSKTSNCVV